jgi:tRNA nucleotidyltransferase/poly(A) polymerase
MMAPGPRTASRLAMSLFEPIFAALENGAVRYVIVGGMATVLHGYARLTADVDIIVDQTPDEARKAIRALAALGLSRVHP